MRPRKDREQPIIELKTVTIPRAQFPTRHQINSPIEIKISPSTLRIEPVRSASLLSLRSEKRSRRSKSRMLAAHGTGSLSIHLVHVCTQVLTYVAHARMRTRVASSWSWAASCSCLSIDWTYYTGSRTVAWCVEGRQAGASKRWVRSLKTCLDIIPPRNISIRSGGSTGKKVKYEERVGE